MNTSLYIHIPFCTHKCSYCSFSIIPTEKLEDSTWFAHQYKHALFRDIDFWREQTIQENLGSNEKPRLYTLYFWWWTPLLFWSRYLIGIVEYVADKFDLSELEELSIECNPYPQEQTLIAIKEIIEQYPTMKRVRFSFGIQSLDNEMLDSAGRQAHVDEIQEFTKQLLQIRDDAIKALPSREIIYNFDFIAFGKNTKTAQNKWLQNLIKSKQIDSFSLYTLELFPWSQRYHGGVKDSIVAYNAPRDNQLPYQANEDSLWEDFSATKQLFLAAWYQRYEISNYALPGKESLHNMVYWSMKPYIWIWLWAHWYVEKQKMMRRTQYQHWWKNYIDWPIEKAVERHAETFEDTLVESLFLWLRKQTGIENIAHYESILVKEYDKLLQKLQQEWLILYNWGHLSLTDKGMDLHHHVCTTIMEKI